MENNSNKDRRLADLSIGTKRDEKNDGGAVWHRHYP